LPFASTGGAVEGIFERHTGEIDLPKLESLLIDIADGSLKNEDVFDDMGHGSLVYPSDPLQLGSGEFDVVVRGPRRALLQTQGTPRLRPYFAVPFGDMMMTGCFGLLAATAKLLPSLADEVWQSMSSIKAGVAPWEIG